VTVQKTVRHDIFGIDKYLGWGAVARELTIHSSSDKEAVLTAAEELGATIGLGERKTSLLMTVAEELTTNALYDAPVDDRQRARHASLPRSERVDLAAHENVHITLASDGRRVGISVEDPFGSLKAETVVEYLAKCFRRGTDQIDRKQGGAGLGLFYAFNSLSHFVVNIEPKQRTEFIGLIEVHGSYRDFEEKPKSFNLFVEE
jgi:signal transduction histidine kinase